MQLMELPLAEAIGHVLCHNLADAQGRKAFHKGHTLRSEDLERLAALGLTTVRVAVFAADDVDEDRAALRLAHAVVGPYLEISAAKGGRVNVRAIMSGPLRVHTAALYAINNIDGLTLATLPSQRLIHKGDLVATIKVIPFAVPDAALCCAEQIGAADTVLEVRPLQLRRVGVILVSSPAARRRVAAGLYPAIEGRVQALQAAVIDVQYVPIESAAIAEALAFQERADAELIIIAGETSIIDIDDVTPQAIRAAGGRIEHYGAPVEPGNLLLLAYLGQDSAFRIQDSEDRARRQDSAFRIQDPGDRARRGSDADVGGSGLEQDSEDRAGRVLPIVGAPGCVRSRDMNIVDLILPRLLAGEIVRRADIVALGHGGLL
jgi:molybdopterin biosynthesis enzyme